MCVLSILEQFQSEREDAHRVDVPGDQVAEHKILMNGSISW